MNGKYLYIPDGDIEFFRHDVKKNKLSKLSKLLNLYNFYSEQQLPFEHPQASITYMGYAAANLSLSYLLTKQDHFLEEAKRWIFTGVKYNNWGRVTMVDNGLDAGWLLFGFSLSFNWIGEYLTAKEIKLLLDKIIIQGDKLYSYVTENPGRFWVSSYHNSYNWVCFTALATAGYAISKDYPKAEKWINSAKENFSHVISVLADDGSFFTGVSFWRYMISWLLKYADLYRSMEGVDLFKKSNFLKNTFYFRLYLSTPNLEEIHNYGDCHDRKSGHCPAAYYKIASEYNNGHAQFLGDYVSKNISNKESYESNIKPGILHEAFLELLWYNPNVKLVSPEYLPKVKYFEDMGLISVRSGWHRDAFFFSFKCGNIGGKKAWKKAIEYSNDRDWHIISASHMHPDNNSFILGAYDTFLAVDDGYSHSKKTSNHNTILVDDSGYTNEGIYNIFSRIPYDVTANINEFINKKDYTFFTGETSKFYSPELSLKSYKRSIFYSNNNYIVIMDELESLKQHKYKWVLNSDIQAKLHNSSVLKIENGRGILYISCIEPRDYNVTFSSKNVSANPSSSTPDFIIKKKIKTVTFENKVPVNDIRFMTLLSVDSIFSNLSYEINQIRNATHIGFKINFQSYSDIFLWSTHSDIIYEGIETDASWAFLRIADKTLDKYSLFHASYLEFNGQVIVNNTSKENIFK